MFEGMKRGIREKCIDEILKNLKNRQEYALREYKSANGKRDKDVENDSYVRWELLETLKGDMQKLKMKV